MKRSFDREVFVDTAALIGLLDEDDDLRDRAKAVEAALGEAGVKLVTSDEVLTEFLAYMSAPRPLRSAAIKGVEVIMRSSEFVVVPCSRGGFLAALDLYSSRRDKGWSLVDCSSMLICRDRGIRQVFTHDHHFRQGGFEILMP